MLLNILKTSFYLYNINKYKPFSGASKQELESFQSRYKSLELKHKEFKKLALQRKNTMKHEQTFQNAIKQCVVVSLNKRLYDYNSLHLPLYFKKCIDC